MDKMEQKVGDNMELFGQDLIIGDFRLSDHGLLLASFDMNGEEEDSIGMDYEVIEEYVGHNPVPVYLGGRYNEKLKPQITIIKNNCWNSGDITFSENECRHILRQLTGYNGYRKMVLDVEDPDEFIYFNVIVQSISYKKIGGKVSGIVISLECDSPFGWSREYENTYEVSAGQTITFYSTSDDLYNYLLPEITIIPKSSIGQLTIKNKSDNNWTTTLSNLSAGEIITMDSKREILLSSKANRVIMNDFNMHFFRLVSGKNEIEISGNVTFTIKCSFPRKVGFV